MCTVETKTENKLSVLDAFIALNNGKIVRANVPREGHYWFIMHQGKIMYRRAVPTKAEARNTGTWGLANFNYNTALGWEMNIYTPEAAKYSFIQAVNMMKEGKHMAFKGSVACCRGNNIVWVSGGNDVHMTVDRIEGEWIEACDL